MNLGDGTPAFMIDVSALSESEIEELRARFRAGQYNYTSGLMTYRDRDDEIATLRLELEEARIRWERASDICHNKLDHERAKVERLCLMAADILARFTEADLIPGQNWRRTHWVDKETIAAWFQVIDESAAT